MTAFSFRKTLFLALTLATTHTAFAHTTPTQVPNTYPNHSGMMTLPTPSTPLLIKPNTGKGGVGLTATGFNETYHNRTIAEWSLQQVNASLPQIHDPWVVDFVYRTTANINALARHQALLATPVINDKNINAFAVTGGLIAINTGVILTSDTLDETASVLAHEVGHLSMRHYERNQDDKGKMMAIQLGGLLAAIAMSAVSGDGAAMAMVGTQVASQETAAAHSRAHEREADRVGMALLAQAGFDVYGMPRFFEKLHRHLALNTTKGAFVPSFVQSHPFSDERLSDTQARAGDYRSPDLASKQENARLFDLLSWRVKYLSKANEEELKQGSKTSTGAKLAYVSFLADARRFDEAERVFDGVSGAVKSEPLYCVTSAHMDYEKGEFDKAVAKLSACYALAPERRDLTLYLADSLVQAGNVSRAEQLLLPLVQKTPHDIIAQDLLQKTYEKLSQSTPSQSTTQKDHFSAKALHARASKELWYGNYDKALISLTQAKSLVKNDKAFVKVLDDEMAKVRRFRDFKVK